MTELKIEEPAEPPAWADDWRSETGKVLRFPMQRVPRLQNLSDDQVSRLIWLLNQTEVLEKLIYEDLPKLQHGCPIAHAILKT